MEIKFTLEQTHAHTHTSKTNERAFVLIYTHARKIIQRSLPTRKTFWRIYVGAMQERQNLCLNNISAPSCLAALV